MSINSGQTVVAGSAEHHQQHSAAYTSREVGPILAAHTID